MPTPLHLDRPAYLGSTLFLDVEASGLHARRATALLLAISLPNAVDAIIAAA